MRILFHQEEVQSLDLAPRCNCVGLTPTLSELVKKISPHLKNQKRHSDLIKRLPLQPLPQINPMLLPPLLLRKKKRKQKSKKRKKMGLRLQKKVNRLMWQ